MQAKNLTMMLYPRAVDFTALAELATHNALRPVGPLEMATVGWVPPLHGEAALVHSPAGLPQMLCMTYATQTKILPPSAIAAAVAARVEEIEQREGRRPGGRERKRLRDDVLHDLLPRALVKDARVRCYIDTARGLLVVDTASRKVADEVTSLLRATLGSFPAMPLNAEVAPRSILTGWIAGKDMPEGMDLGEECELKDPAEGGAVVRCQKQELRCAEIDKHLDAGKQVTRLAVTVQDTVSCTIDDTLTVRKFKLLDGALDALEDQDLEGRTQEFDARAALLYAEAGGLFDHIKAAFLVSEVAHG